MELAMERERAHRKEHAFANRVLQDLIVSSATADTSVPSATFTVMKTRRVMAMDGVAMMEHACAMRASLAYSVANAQRGSPEKHATYRAMKSVVLANAWEMELAGVLWTGRESSVTSASQTDMGRIVI